MHSTMERESQLSQAGLWPPHVHHGMHTAAHAPSRSIIKDKKHEKHTALYSCTNGKRNVLCSNMESSLVHKWKRYRTLCAFCFLLQTEGGGRRARVCTCLHISAWRLKEDGWDVTKAISRDAGGGAGEMTRKDGRNWVIIFLHFSVVDYISIKAEGSLTDAAPPPPATICEGAGLCGNAAVLGSPIFF